MAEGTLQVFDKAKKSIGSTFDMSNSGDFYAMIITSLPTVSDAVPDTSSYTEIAAGTTYTAGGMQLTTTWNEATGTVTFDSGTNPLWEHDAVSGAENAVAVLIYSSTAVSPNGLCFLDLTIDGGVTPKSLKVGRISVTFNDLGVFSIA